eukprot:gene16097-biopygen17229
MLQQAGGLGVGPSRNLGIRQDRAADVRRGLAAGRSALGLFRINDTFWAATRHGGNKMMHSSYMKSKTLANSRPTTAIWDGRRVLRITAQAGEWCRFFLAGSLLCIAGPQLLVM